jgi:hypothetical protein
VSPKRLADGTIELEEFVRYEYDVEEDEWDEEPTVGLEATICPGANATVLMEYVEEVEEGEG